MLKMEFYIVNKELPINISLIILLFLSTIHIVSILNYTITVK